MYPNLVWTKRELLKSLQVLEIPNSVQQKRWKECFLFSSSWVCIFVFVLDGAYIIANINTLF